MQLKSFKALLFFIIDFPTFPVFSGIFLHQCSLEFAGLCFCLIIYCHEHVSWLTIVTTVASFDLHKQTNQ